MRKEMCKFKIMSGLISAKDEWVTFFHDNGTIFVEFLDIYSQKYKAEIDAVVLANELRYASEVPFNLRQVETNIPEFKSDKEHLISICTRVSFQIMVTKIDDGELCAEYVEIGHLFSKIDDLLKKMKEFGY